jgi:hypothetical protein
MRLTQGIAYEPQVSFDCWCWRCSLVDCVSIEVGRFYVMFLLGLDYWNCLAGVLCIFLPCNEFSGHLQVSK